MVEQTVDEVAERKARFLKQAQVCVYSCIFIVPYHDDGRFIHVARAYVYNDTMCA